ncbi:MAG TPA: class I SAM-dependent RNA methyltransferase [Streptosporangiaceae bacterium]
MPAEDMTVPSRSAPAALLGGDQPVSSPSDQPVLSPGDEIELVAGEVANGGWCVARLDGSGPVVFVRHTLPGERIRARITEVTARFARADAIQILAPAAGRVEPPCPYAHPGGCGGCDWQHASLPAQRELKAVVVRQQLRRIAGIEWPVTVEPLPGDAPDDTPDGPGPGPGLGWRTRVTFAVRPDGVAGLRGHRSHQVAEIGDCLIAHPRIRDLGVPRRRWPRARSVTAATGTGGPERAVIVTGGRPPADPAQLAAETVIGQARGRTTVVRGRPFLLQQAAGRSWRVSAAGFWQVHPALADVLATAVLEALRPQPGDTALDLYCGAGLFTGVLAAAVGPDGAVTGVEMDRTAVRDARRNLRGMPWATVYQGDAGQILARRDLAPARLTVLDPPRAGVSRDVLGHLVRSAPGLTGQRRIAYVSCDPATLARDIALLLPHGWRLESLRAFDAFPMTHHIECLAVLAAA